MSEIPFGILPQHYGVIMNGEGDDTFVEALRDFYADNPNAIEFIDKNYQRGDYMKTHQDLLKRRSRRGQGGLKEALLGKLNDLT